MSGASVEGGRDAKPKITLRTMSEAELDRYLLACERGMRPSPFADVQAAGDTADVIWFDETMRIGLFMWNIHLLTAEAWLVLQQNIRHRLREYDSEPELQRAIKNAHIKRWGALGWWCWFSKKQIARLVAADVDPGVPVAVTEWPRDLMVKLS